MRTFFLLFMLALSSTALAGDGGFIFVTFKGESTPMTEQVYFALSQDGRHWEALNGSEPVLVNNVGEKGTRDPYIFRSHDGKKCYIVATDSSHYFNPGWKKPPPVDSKSLLIWESDDLTHWSEPRLVPMAPEAVKSAWAPEVIYDEETQDYLVYWASKTTSDNVSKFCIWACRTKDFRAFDKPFLYMERPRDVFDADIVRENGVYYRFAKTNATKAITMEASDKLMGPWRDVPGFTQSERRDYEGPECFLLEPGTPDQPPTWCLLLDYFAKEGGYQAFVTHDLASGKFEPAPDFSFPFRFRHGSVLAITPAERERLKAAYGDAPR